MPNCKIAVMQNIEDARYNQFYTVLLFEVGYTNPDVGSISNIVAQVDILTTNSLPILLCTTLQHVRNNCSL